MGRLSRTACALVTAAGGLAAGCAGGIAVPAPAAPAATSWQHALSQEAAQPVDLRGWWHAFQDPVLDGLVDSTLRDNLQAAQAAERLLASRERLRSAQVEYRPQLRAKTIDAIDPDASASFFVAGFDASWELGLFGRATATQRQVRGEVDAGAASLQQLRVSLVGEVVRDWLSLRAAQQRDLLLEAACGLYQRQLDQTRIHAGLRLATPQALARAEADLAQAQAERAGHRGDIDALAQQLALLLGRERPDPAWLEPAPVPSLGALHIVQTPADLLRTRPEIAQAEAEVLRAVGDAGIARADLLPRVAIGGSIVWSTNLTTHRRTSDHALVSVGPLIDIPLFDWGARQARLRASRHDLQASVYAYRQAVLQGVAEVETALAQLEHQRERQAAGEQAHQALARAEQAATTRARLHLASPAEHGGAQLALVEASLALNEATAARGQALVSLYKALGGAPLPEPVTLAAGQP